MTPLAIGVVALVALLGGLAALWLGLGLLRLGLALAALALLYPCSYLALRGARVIEAHWGPGGRGQVAVAGPGWLSDALRLGYRPCLWAEGLVRSGAP